MSRIAIDHAGILVVGDAPLPCLVTGLSCRGEIVIDSSRVEGSSGKRKVFDGWDDWDITISALLYERDERTKQRYNHLRTINEAFKRLEGGLPIIYALESELAAALNIRHVLFAGLDVNDDIDDDAIELSINFTEHDPVVALVQQQQQEAEQTTATAPPTDSGSAATAGETVETNAYSQADLASLRAAERLHG